MKKLALASVVGLMSFSVQASEQCVGIADDERRLACYDAEYQPKGADSIESEWSVSTRTSPIDDSLSVFISAVSKDEISNRFGQRGEALLMLRCVENRTSMILSFAGNHMADLNQYGQVTLRIDDQQARTLSMDESTDNGSLGLWSGGQSIPVIQQMFGHDTLTVRATPFSGSPITTQFPITGLEEAIIPLREACNW